MRRKISYKKETGHEEINQNQKKKSCPNTGLNRPTGFQEVKAPRFLDIGTWRW
jgi:hypothetical protein